MKEIIYLLGLPCVGKSTIVEEWKKRGGLVLPEFLEPVPDFVHNSWLGNQKSKLDAQKWALEQHYKKDQLIKDLKTESPVVVERSPLDALVYGRVLGGEARSWTETQISKRQWAEGTLVLLQAAQDVLRQRWVSGRGLTTDDWNLQWGPFSNLLQDQYLILRNMFGIPIVRTDLPLEGTMKALEDVSLDKSTYKIESLIFPLSSKER